MRQTFTVAACVSALALLTPRGRQARPAGNTLKNVKVLTDLTEQQFDDAMMSHRGSLGVQCEHCHNEKDWSSDERAKRTARKMIQMVRDINRTLGNDLAVSCYSCHRGKRPATTLPLLTERPRLYPWHQPDAGVESAARRRHRQAMPGGERRSGVVASDHASRQRAAGHVQAPSARRRSHQGARRLPQPHPRRRRAVHEDSTARAAGARTTAARVMHWAGPERLKRGGVLADRAADLYPSLAVEANQRSTARGCSS
jgi:hypothetical protein